MYNSSVKLHNQGDYHNACYLSGYVVECYAKIIVGLSYGFNSQDIAKEFRHDLNKLNKELQYILNNSPFSMYIVDFDIEFMDIINGPSKWNPIKRYSNTTWSLGDSTNFQNQIPKAMQLLAQLSLNTSSNLI
jgi:hypothetical protein